ncbi:hypothetical protein EVAR_78454_1 [Eumeta japonica]|uniref:Uncharacterized protein n=1 Tax=Eumeta variegata TaxID=151549 RepID=A0A4C1TZF0_EUMVA|nr:hypothetical protein EVAR_78454_1 [Eumeta japonica]
MSKLHLIRARPSSGCASKAAYVDNPARRCGPARAPRTQASTSRARDGSRACRMCVIATAIKIFVALYIITSDHPPASLGVNLVL